MERLRKILAPAFTVERVLGSGGMGVVFLGHDVALDRPVAIKVLHPEMFTAELGERFLLEARTLARLSTHPHIVPIHQVIEREGLYLYIMDYLGEETLSTQLERGRFTPARALRLGLDLLNGLVDVHKIGVVHRDIKPSNIFLSNGRAMLGDFGIAHVSRSEESQLTIPGQLIGTPAYMSPEQAAGLQTDGRSDLYSLGVVLYEVLTGRLWTLHTRPKAGDWTGVPRRMTKVLQRALEPAREDRWATAEAFSSALERSSARAGIWVWALPLLSAMIILGVWLWDKYRDRPHACLPPAPADLALLPFTVSEPSPGLNGQDFARLVQLELEWFRRVRVTPDAALSCWADPIPGPRREALAVQQLGARQVVSGLLLRQSTGWALRVTVRDSEPAPQHVFTVVGDSNDVLGWSRAAADSIVRRVFPQYLAYYREIRPHGAPDRQVYKYYFAGEQEFQRDAYEHARADYDSALALDPTFVPASWRLGIVYRFLRLPFEDHLRRLLDAHRDELPEQNVALITALLEPDLNRRFADYRAAVEKYPRDGYVTFVYADELFHRGPLVGYPLDSALAQFRAAVAIEPELDQLPAFDHLFYGYQKLGNRGEARTYLARRNQLAHSGEPEGEKRGKFLQLAYDERFRPSVGAIKRFGLGILADSATMVGMNRYIRLGSSFDIPETQLSLGAMLARNGLDQHSKANGHRAEGLALMMLGRPIAALPELDTAAVTWGESDSLLERAEWRVLPGVLGLPGVPATDREWGLNHLRSLAGPDAIGARALWALAVEAYSRADSAAALGYAASMTSPGAARLRELLDALQDAAAGRPAQALARSEPLISYAGRDAVRDPFARSILYLHRMQWQLALGDSTAAGRTRLWYLNSDSGIEGWPQNGVEPGEIDAIMGVYARLLQAEADRAAGNLTSACAAAGRVRELWHEAEPSFAPLKARADSAAMGCSS